MTHKNFLAFILPSIIAMLLFIALPIGSIVVQSLYTEHPQVLVEVENCGPFGCETETRVNTEAMEEIRAAEPLGQFNGLGTYFDRRHLAVEQVGEIFRNNDGLADIAAQLYNLPFYKALSFTLVYTFLVTPLGMALGFSVALAVNAIPRFMKGPVIFFSLLPLIVTPLVGSLILFWMINTRGVLGSTLQVIFSDPTLSLRASAVLTWVMLIVYGIWSMAPFSFVVFYAGLQTVPSDTLESAKIDGANRWEQIRYVTVPHLIPLMTFVALVQLMDNFRVFEPIVGFNAEANATSLSWSIFNDLRGAANQQFSSAAATSVLTVIGVVILLMPVLVRLWRDFNRKAARG